MSRLSPDQSCQGGSVHSSKKVVINASASSSCVNIADDLSRQWKLCRGDNVRAMGRASFSIVMSSTEARLYVSWKRNELDFSMQGDDSFLL